MFKSRSKRIILAFVGIGSSALFINRKIQYNQTLDNIRENIVNCTGVNDLLHSNTALASCEPVKFIYDQTDKKLSFFKLQTFADLLKTALIELIPNDDNDVEDDEKIIHSEKLPISKYSLVTCRSQFLYRQMANEIARHHRQSVNTGISFVYLYPEKPKRLNDSIHIFFDYIQGTPQWLNSYGKVTIELSKWLKTLSQSVCPLNNNDNQIISVTSRLPLMIQQFFGTKCKFTCALNEIKTESCIIRCLELKDESLDQMFSWWHPSTWFARSRRVHEWTEWKTVKDVKLLNEENNHIYVTGKLENGDNFVSRCTKCEIEKGCSLTIENDGDYVSYCKKSANSDVTVEIANPYFTPTFILLNPTPK